MPWVVAVGHGLCHAREGLCPKAWKGSHAAHKEEWAPLFIAYNTEWYWQLLLTDNVKEGLFFFFPRKTYCSPQVVITYPIFSLGFLLRYR